MSNNLLTYKETCEKLGLKSYQGLYALINAGLPVINVAGLKRVSIEDLENFLEAHKIVKAK